MAFTDGEIERYSRHLALTEVGRSGQEKLHDAHVLIVGCGGLGSPAALYLAASGVGTLGVVDADVVDLSNLQRQILFHTSDIGKPKATVAQRRLFDLNPNIEIVAHTVELRAENVLEIVRQYDLVLDGTDSIATRYLVNDACVILGKPLISAAIYQFEGQAMTYLPGRGPCYRCLFPDATASVVASCAVAGVLGVLPGVLGLIQATEAIKIIIGQGEPLVGRLLTYDALGMSFHEFSFSWRDDCAVCGRKPSIFVPTDAATVCYDAPPGLRRLSPSDLRALILHADRGGRAILLIDVREPEEFAAGHLSGALSVPLAEVERGQWECSENVTTVFMCRTGARSLRACAVAGRHGFANPSHLEGGLKAWKAAIDSSLHVL